MKTDRTSLISSLWLLLLCLLFVAGEARAVSFESAVTYPAGDGPGSVTTADFNKDSNLDLVVVNELTHNISIRLGNGDGTFQDAVNYTVGQNPTSATCDDFNKDGNLDLAVTNFADNNVSILLGNGDGTFNPAVNYAIGQNHHPWEVTAGDFNGDGNLDLAMAAVINWDSDYVWILLGNGDGTFNPAGNYAVGDRPMSVTTGDFSGDGNLDLAVANAMSNTVSILLGNGNGTFNAAVNYAVGEFPIAVIPGDFNEDGHLDLAVANDNATNATVSVLIGNGNGTFQPAVNYDAGSNPFSITTGDFDRDGNLDLALTRFPTDNVSVLIGNGNGTFDGAVLFAAGDGPISLAAGDFDKDGRLDLATANNTGDNVSILRNNTTAPNALLGITPGSGDFGLVNVDSTGPKVFTLSNNGSADLVIASMAMTGGDAAMFRLAARGRNHCPSVTPTIPPGGSCTVTAKFTPSTEGAKTTTLRVTSNDPAGPVDIPLNGTGTLLPEFPDCPETSLVGDFEDFINTIYYYGITAGCEGGNFCPNDPVTRKQMAAFIVTSMGETPSTAAYNAYFDDIVNDSFAPYINRVSELELGISAGCAPRAYCPENILTRAQMAVFIIMALGETGSTEVYNVYFDDIANDAFAPFINRMNELGITGGCAPRAYCPNDSMSRAMMAVFLVTAFF